MADYDSDNIPVLNDIIEKKNHRQKKAAAMMFLTQSQGKKNPSM